MNHYERKEVVSLEEVEKEIKHKVMGNLFVEKKNLNVGLKYSKIRDEKIYTLSDRYKLFFLKGYKCVECGLEGKYFALERTKEDNSKRYHLNLYAIDDNGCEVMMTKDHIVPKSLGGKDSVKNYQTMCSKCNEKKGNKIV